MKTNIIFIDIETTVASDLKEELKPECKLGKPPELKTAHLTDPVKIGAKNRKYADELLAFKAKKESWEAGGQIKAMSLDTMMNQIVCIEMLQSWDNRFASDVSKQMTLSEKWYLNRFWDIQENYTTLLVGFNILNFDLPTIINRSMLLGVTTTTEIPLRPYSRYPVYDMAMILCGGKLKELKKFNWYLKRFGLPAKTGDGSQVYGWHQAGEYKKISEYCKADVLACKALFEKMIDYYPLPRNYDREQYDND